MVLLFSIFILCGQSADTGLTTRTVPDSLRHYFAFDDPAPLSCLFTYFPPIFIQHGMELKDFLRSRDFRALRGAVGDLKSVDAIFVRAMQLTDNNTAVALLISAIATFDHRSVGLKVPVFQLYFPLTNESAEDFEERVHCLPARLYPDTPPDPYGDRDKLQHFFGSAFLTFLFESRPAGERFGMFVEEGEDAFIVGGILDSRDMRANRNGQQFGNALLADQHVYPSLFIRMTKPRHLTGADYPGSVQGVE